MIKKYIYLFCNFLFKDFSNFFFNQFKNYSKITILDVGCFRGTFFNLAKYLKNTYIKAYLFDPNPSVAQYLDLKKNKKINYKFYNVAASNKNGKSKFYFNSSFESSGSSLIKNVFADDKKWNFSRNLFLKFFFQKTKGFKEIIVNTIKLDDFIKKHAIKKINILKIDVEGGEELVLKGLKKTLNKGVIDYLQIEITAKKNNYKIKEKRIKKFLKKNKYKLIKKINLSTVKIFSNIMSTDSLYENIKLNS